MKNRLFVAWAAGFALLGLIAIASAEPAPQPEGWLIGRNGAGPTATR